MTVNNNINRKINKVISLADPLRAERLNKLREERRKERREVTLFRSPVRSLYVFTLVTMQYFWRGIGWVRTHKKKSLAFVAFVALLFVLNHMPGAHTQVSE